MDSMRNLSTSLPGRRRADGSELLTDFRAAALSVTNLYKSAAAAQAKSRAAGYQDALDDLLVFLDKENLGLMDGEGWKVRQWATEHLDNGIQKQAGSEDDEDVKENVGRPESRSSSPDMQRKTAVPTASSDIAEEPTVHHRPRVATESPAPRQARAQTPQRTQITHIPREEFTFRSNHAYPSNHDREGTMDLDTNSTASTATSTPSTTDTVRIVSRARNRHNHHHRQRDNRTVNLNLSSGAGNKRKIPYPEFFDISGVNFDGHDRKEGPGGRGGKRGRHV
ncbi:hypothetical protein LTR78_001382 [Recurvomyces mirabilis]|uniref:Uncharacterized protein n=1 Tax=Recurvomyces mirabilis TaxID=574656 RepID=A0AAE1C5K1_9PEZI|nr:hypothetical protein LTR78_001382 [Recurvomyces mirabilis]KAK5161359.1 hypothetical protein LTS14_001155 [Recurvomyces mirabilis]